MKPYKEYRQSLKDGNFKLASEHAFKAWQTAEELMGDDPTTGSLAQNYADLGFSAELKYKPVKQAYLRSIELSDSPESRMQLESAFALFASRNKKPGDVKDRFEDVVTYANQNGMENSTFLGEIYTVRAEIANKIHKKKEMGKYSRKALEIFETSDDGYTSAMPWVASLYSGYANEYEKDLIPALMDYQKVMENTEQALQQDHPLVSKALGRWMLMRSRIRREGLTAEAESAGMCECWPYDKARNESVKPIKRIPGKMPRKAYISGYAIVRLILLTMVAF